MGQPGSALVNHLGFTNVWYTPSVTRYSRFYTSPVLRNSTFLLRVYVNSGVIHTINLFISCYWTRLVHPLSIPTVTTFGSFSKFYRMATIKNERLRLKKRYVLRRNSDSINVSVASPVVHQGRVWFFMYTPLFRLNSSPLGLLGISGSRLGSVYGAYRELILAHLLRFSLFGRM